MKIIYPVRPSLHITRLNVIVKNTATKTDLMRDLIEP